MRQRDAILVLVAVLLAVAVSAVLVVGSIAARGTELRPRLFVGDRPPPVGRVVDFRPGQAEPAIPGGAGRIVVREPVPGEAVVVPLQRGLADGARDAAGYLLVLLGVAASLVLAKEPVLACYRAAAGGWVAQARVLATGVAVLALIASAAVLAFVVMIGSAANLRASLPLPFQPFLQIGLVALVVAGAVVALVTIVGLAAAAWRLGDAILALRPLAAWSGRVPAPLVATLGTTLIYLAAQLPYAGGLVALIGISYALGTVASARLGHPVDASPRIPEGGSSQA